MARRSPAKGKFTPSNPAKYIAANINNITYRSSWEQSMMMVLDSHPSIIGWASEAIKIPYINPLTRRNTIYVPDFFVVYNDKNDVQHKELIEVKPAQEVMGYTGKVSKLIEARQIVNMCKWRAALAFCASRNWRFRVATEHDLFGFKKKSGV